VIQQINKLDSHIIRIGQRLMIPSASQNADTYSLSAAERLSRKQDRAGRKAGGKRVDYTVRSGDTFWDIAREHDVSITQLARWNRMSRNDTLSMGKSLDIWTEDGPVDNTRALTYSVRRGDSLSLIARKFKVNVNDIITWNGLNKNKYLQPGQRLKLMVDITKS
jgi:membrane-bound lytic murein transglycosylase D